MRWGLVFPKAQLARPTLIVIMITALLPLPFLTMHIASVNGQQMYAFTLVVEGTGYLSVNGSPRYPKTPPGTYNYEAGTVLSIQWVHTRDSGGGGSDIDHYEVNGINIGIPPSPYIIIMNADYVLKAVFVPIVPISFSLNPLSATVHENDSVTFVATTNGKGVPPIWLYWYLNGTIVNSSYDFSYSHQWTFEPSDPGTYQIYVTGTDSWEATPPSEWPKSQVATVNVQGVKIKAHCNIEDADISVNIMMDSSPTGYSTPHTFEGLSGTHTFAVQPIDPQGHTFKQWSTGETNPTLTISSDGTYTAYYPAERALTIISTVGGTTNPEPGSYIYYDQTIANVTAQPDTRYCLDHWELDGINIGNANPLNVSLNMDRTLEAVFARVTFTLTVIANDGGATTPVPGVYTHSDDSVVSISALPKTGYYLDSLELDGLHIGLSEPENITIDANHTLQAKFNPLKTGDDVAAKWISSKTVVNQGFSTIVRADVVNIGSFLETISVNLFANATNMDSQIVTVESGQSARIFFTLNTSGLTKGNYSLSIYAWPVQGETDIDDNYLTDSWIFVTMIGDITGGPGSNSTYFVPDGKCDIRDIAAVAKGFGSIPGDPAWNADCDVNDDGIVNIKDIAIVAKHFGEDV